MIREIKVSAGEHIDGAVERLVAAAQEPGSAFMTFNGIRLEATPGSTVASILLDWQTKQMAAAEAYRTSPEGKKAEQERENSRANAQQKHDALMRKLPGLNMRNDYAVLDWLCEMQKPSDHVGVIVRSETIVSAFEKAGYVAGANCGKDYRPGNRDNMFRYLVGQALDGLKNGPAIHSIIHKFADEWRREFAQNVHLEK